MGARFAGMRPDLGPLGHPSRRHPGLNAAELLSKAATEGWDVLYVAGANLAAKSSKKLWKDVRSRLGFLVVQDLFLTRTAQEADVVLPTLSYVEKNGSFINIAGGTQFLLPGKEIPDSLYSDGEIFERIAQKLGFTLAIDPNFTETLKGGRQKRVFSDKAIGSVQSNDKEYDGKLHATFAYTLFDRGVRMNHNPHLSRFVKEPRIRLNTLDAFRLNSQMAIAFPSTSRTTPFRSCKTR